MTAMRRAKTRSSTCKAENKKLISRIAQLKDEVDRWKYGHVVNLPEVPSQKPFFLSYAQDYEDLILYSIFENTPGGFYIDVGANHPIRYSVTKVFYELGWSGINIEPLPYHFDSLQRDQPRDVNLCLCAGSQAGETGLYEHDLMSSTIENTTQFWKDTENYQFTERTVQVATLESICDQYCPNKQIHFLKIDVEESEEAVIRGANFHKHTPIVVVIESLSGETPSWEQLLIKTGYTYVYIDTIFRNRYYIHNRFPEFRKRFRNYHEMNQRFIVARRLQ